MEVLAIVALFLLAGIIWVMNKGKEFVSEFKKGYREQEDRNRFMDGF